MIAGRWFAGENLNLEKKENLLDRSRPYVIIPIGIVIIG